MKSTFKKQNSKNGFTLIETLVAITILMISIVGPLTIANKGLVAAVGSRDQVVASYLAQDLMEYIKNMRDDYLLANSGTGFSAFLLNLSGHGCPAGSPCGIETAPNPPDVLSGNIVSGCGAGSTNCNLFINGANSYYTYNSVSATSTEFNRSFTVTPETVSSGLTDGALVTVTVTWQNGTIKNQVVLKNMLFNTLR